MTSTSRTGPDGRSVHYIDAMTSATSETHQLLPILQIRKGEVPDARIGTRPT
jgi:hypothetical protein